MTTWLRTTTKRRRLSISHVRAYHASLNAARSVGILDVVEVLAYWQRNAFTPAPPRRVFWQTHNRSRREWDALHATLAALPAPQPPEGKVFGFSNGTEYDIWTGRNCEGCALAGDPSEAGSSRCAIFEAIHDTTDGCVPADIARRMGYRATAPHWGTCPEREVGT